MDNWLTLAQIRGITDAFLPPALSNRRSLVAALGHRLSWLMSYAGCLRGDSVRKLELSDLLTLHLEGEGSTPCNLMVLTLGQGKTNRFGKYDRTAIMRHREPNLCSQGALALYFVALWEVLEEDFPSFHRSSDFFQIKMIRPMSQGRRRLQPQESAAESDDDMDEDEDENAPDFENDEIAALFRKHCAVEDGENGDTPACTGPVAHEADEVGDAERAETRVQLKGTTPTDPRMISIGYDSQQKAVKAALQVAGVVTTHATHAGRVASASTISRDSEDQYARRHGHGHWNKDTLSNVYITPYRRWRFCGCPAEG